VDNASLAGIGPSIFDDEMVLPDLPLYFCDHGCLFAVVVDDLGESFQELLLVVLVRQVVLQPLVLVGLPLGEHIPLVSQPRAHLFGDFEVVFLVDDVLDVVLGALQFEALDPCPQLPHHSFLHGQFLHEFLVRIFAVDFFVDGRGCS
jgi:hypothetical protein